MMDIHKILSLLPHRYPILLVDRVLELDKGKSIKALKNVTINEEFFNGHFPHRPVMPGVLMLEALAQAAALLAFDALDMKSDGNSVYYFAGIDGARFKRPVEPGDQLILHVTMGRMKAGTFKFQAKAMVGDELAVEAELTCALRKIPSAATPDVAAAPTATPAATPSA
jgi:3-hydroxyacyl-[acyl-carrier-protein] dehydratase